MQNVADSPPAPWNLGSSNGFYVSSVALASKHLDTSGLLGLAVTLQGGSCYSCSDLLPLESLQLEMLGIEAWLFCMQSLVRYYCDPLIAIQHIFLLVIFMAARCNNKLKSKGNI